jgi:NAD(P)-dependent dehydrogenase (short-subunit alcohol dehydrogenase family)
MENENGENVIDLFSLKNRVVLITGAAGQLGECFCDALSGAGADLAVTDINGESSRLVAEKYSERGTRCKAFELDVTSAVSIKDAVVKILNEFGRIDVLINNAGVGVFTPFEERTEEEFSSVLEVNLKGTFLCSQIISEQMILQGHGNIINIGSIYGIVSSDPDIYGVSGRNNSEVYSCSKAAVIQMTRYLAVYLAKYNIRVNCISPGGIFNYQEKGFVESYIKKTPLGRMGECSDLKGAIVYLASDASSYVTGHNLVVDGGFTIW